MHIVHLLLELTSQILDIFFLPLQVDVQLFSLSAKARVFISRNVVLNLQVPVHIPNLFFLYWLENRCLVSLNHISVVIHALVYATTSSRCWCSHGSVATAEKDITRAIVVDYLLVDAVTFLTASVGQATARLDTRIHGANLHRVEWL